MAQKKKTLKMSLIRKSFMEFKGSRYGKPSGMNFQFQYVKWRSIVLGTVSVFAGILFIIFSLNDQYNLQNLGLGILFILFGLFFIWTGKKMVLKK